MKSASEREVFDRDSFESENKGSTPIKTAAQERASKPPVLMRKKEAKSTSVKESTEKIEIKEEPDRMITSKKQKSLGETFNERQSPEEQPRPGHQPKNSHGNIGN
jgi:hypothetical protein